MSTPMSSPYAGSGARSDQVYEYDDSHSQGLVTFAGVMIMIAAVLNILYGIAAIDQATFFVNDAKYVFADLKTFGWLVLALGVIQVFAALAIWQGTPWGRWFGVGSASVNIILQMLWLPARPVLAMTILALDIVVIYGLLAYGGRRRAELESRAREEARLANQT
jgi:hypothetical protein